MLGVILCGGESSRMGKDKGLLVTEEKTWARIAVEKMEQLQIPVVVSVNKRQQEGYENIFPETKLIFDDEDITLKGPVAGILRVHLQNPTEDLFVLACDMPLMETVVMKDLCNYYFQNNQFEAFVYINDDVPEPLCSIYTSKGLDCILKMYYRQKLVKHSMKFILEQLQVYRIPITENKKGCFRNFNTPSV